MGDWETPDGATCHYPIRARCRWLSQPDQFRFQMIVGLGGAPASGAGVTVEKGWPKIGRAAEQLERR
jgi:hypothetical protein